MKNGILVLLLAAGLVACSREEVDRVQLKKPMKVESQLAPVPAIPQAPEAATDDLREIYLQAAAAVREKLKSPSTAKFPGSYDASSKMDPYGYHQWIVSGIVDAQNGFGAMIRYQWAAVMVKKGSWFAAYIEIGDSKFGIMPVSLPFPLTPRQIAAAKAEAEYAKEVAAKNNAAALSRALASNQAAADKGDAYGLLRMGERYRDGDGVAQDLPTARAYLTKAATAGSPSAQAALDKLPK